MKSRAECLAEYGSDYMIQQKVDSGELFRVGKAVYSENDHVPEIAVLAYQCQIARQMIPNPAQNCKLNDSPGKVGTGPQDPSGLGARFLAK